MKISTNFLEKRCFFLGTIIFITLIQANSQNITWAKQFGGAGAVNEGLSIAKDASGNVYTTGYFYETTDFDPGPGIYNMTSANSGSAFISKLNSTGDFVWAKQLSGSDLVRGFSIAVDPFGNIFTAGSFSGIADFDPNGGTFDLTSAGYEDAFFLKLDDTGNFLWASRIGGDGNEEGHALSFDSNGNLYSIGLYSGTVDFDPSPGILNLTSAGANDFFILKLDPSGNFLWATSMGGGNDNEGLSIKVDASGNIYSTGRSKGTSDFDPGPGIFNLTSAGANDVFISKLDASGNFVWANLFGSIEDDQGWSIVVDDLGNFYCTGWFHGTVDFDPGAGTFNLSSNGVEDVFILKLDAFGNFLWAKQLGGTSEEQSYCITLDASQNVYTTGYFRETIDFDPGPGIFNLISTNASSVFISKLDASGNFVWAKQLGGEPFGSAAGGNSIIVQDDGMVNVTGLFVGTVDFDPNMGTFLLTSIGTQDIFVYKMDMAPTFTLNIESNNGSCWGGGSSTANAIGGTPPFSYIWSNGATTSTASDLLPGTYTVTVTDALNSPTLTAMATIDNPILCTGQSYSIQSYGSECNCSGDFDLNTYFQTKYPNANCPNTDGVLIGDQTGTGFYVRLTSADAIRTFLQHPGIGTPDQLTSGSCNPPASSNTLAMQAVATTLNIKFFEIGNQYYGFAPALGKTIDEILSDANTLLANGTSNLGLSFYTANTILNNINRNYYYTNNFGKLFCPCGN